VGPDQAIFHVDLFDPCWLWPDASLDDIDHIAVNVGSIPFNFQLWKDIKSVVTRKPLKYPAGELQVHLDRCDGDLLAAVALAPALANAGTTQLEVPIGHHAGTHSLCLRFATGKYDPLWAIDWVQLVPAH
jgi:hexosaminidase